MQGHIILILGTANIETRTHMTMAVVQPSKSRLSPRGKQAVYTCLTKKFEVPHCTQ